MIPRPVLLTGMLGAAVAAPIAVTEGPKHLGAFNFGAPSVQPAAAAPRPAPLNANPQGPGSLIYQSPAPLEGVRFVSLAEMLRMDVTKEWVYARWARKSTGLADPELFGVRAPVVTGTGLQDLAGSISYYFNAEGRCDRVRFHGRTADTTQLVAVAQSQFGMRRQPTAPGEQLYQAKWSGRVLSELRTRTEPVLWSTSPHDSFVVDLELNRPGAGRFVEQRRLTPDIPPPPTPVAEPTDPAPTVAAAEATAEAKEADAPEGGETADASLTNALRPAFRWPN